MLRVHFLFSSFTSCRRARTLRRLNREETKKHTLTITVTVLVLHLFSGHTLTHFHNTYYRFKRSADADELPVETDLDISVSGSKVTLHLRRNDNINPSGPIYMKRNGRIHKIDLPPRNVSR